MAAHEKKNKSLYSFTRIYAYIYLVAAPSVVSERVGFFSFLFVNDSEPGLYLNLMIRYF